MNEWLNEPNSLDGEKDGLKWFIRRSQHTGALCGYVEYPFEVFSDLRSTVHGGITYNGDGFDGMTKHVVGFDCAHAGDFCPAINLLGDETIAFARHSVYRNIAYVEREVMVLLEDVLEVKKYPIIIPYGDMKYDDEYHYVRHGGILVLTGIAFADEEQAVLARLTAHG